MKWPDEKLRSKPWTGLRPPDRILIIRLQAFGDTVITLPWIASLQHQLPHARIDLLILERNADIPRGIRLFDRVFGLRGATARWQFIFANLLLPSLFLRRYQVVIDLQRNRISRWIRLSVFPTAWSEIERFSKSLAGEKFRRGIEAAGFRNMQLVTAFHIKEDSGSRILKEAGWNGIDQLVILNPAGAWISRNWPLESYFAFAGLWLQRIHAATVFLFLGTDRMESKALTLSTRLGSKHSINLTGRLSAIESFSVLRHASFVLTEDGGLMHMAWVQRVPTLALFGSSPSYWSAPMGNWSKCLNSSDLPCGNCFSETCRFGDVHCLTRYTPEHVIEASRELLSGIGK